MARNDQVTRIYKVLQILETSRDGMAVKEVHEHLSDHTKVAERTVRRDLDALIEAGFPIEVKERREAGQSESVRVYQIDRTVAIGKSLVLTPGELLSLYFARGMLQPLEGTCFYADLASFFLKIDSLLTERSREHLNELTKEVSFEPTPRWSLGVNPDIVETIRSAATEGHQLKVVYQGVSKGTPDVAKERLLGPHFLYFSKGSLYLIAEDLGDHKVKTFALPRMQVAEMLTDLYEGERVDPEKYFSGSFGVYRQEKIETIELVFRAPIASYVKERRWHSSQRVTALTAGEIRMTLEMGVTPDLVQWVLGYGADVRVSKPETLKRKIKEAAEAVVELYEQGSLKRMKQAS